MPCQLIEIGSGLQATICGVPLRGGKRCVYCGRDSEFLCDFPVLRKEWLGIWQTCDRALCGRCRGRGISKDVDFCREHYEPAKAAHERRMKKAA